MEENIISESNSGQNVKYSESSSMLDKIETNNKVLSPKEQLNLLIDSLIDLYSKKQYKKILEKLSTSDDNEEESEIEENIINNFEWELQYLETVSIQKIVQRKNKNYRHSKIPHFNKYIEKENIAINKWLLIINELIKKIKENNNVDKIKCFLEFCINFILQKCINMSTHCIHHKKIKTAVCFLSLGVNLINHIYSFFSSPESNFLSGQIFLFLSSILVVEENYESAKNLINLSLKFFYMSLELILFSSPNQISYSVFNLLNQTKQIYDYITNNIFYLSTCFYQLGVCYESQGLPYYSYYSYKHSRFFSSIFEDVNGDISRFSKFIREIEKTQLLRNRIIIFFERFVTEEELKDKEPVKKKVYKEFVSYNDKKAKRYLKLEKYISNMKLIEVDDDELDLFDKIDKHFKYNVNLVTKKIHLLDYLMSDNFQETIKNMKKIRINKLDRETIDIISKKIINIKNNERDKLSLKLQRQKNINEKKDKDNEKEREKEKEKEYFKTIEAIIKNRKPSKYKTLRTTSSTKTLTSGKKTRVSSSYKNSKYSQILMTDINYSVKSDSFFSFNTRPNTAHNDINLKRGKFGKGRYYSEKNINKRSQILFGEKFKYQENKGNKENKLIFSYTPKIKYKIPKYSTDKYIFNKKFLKKKKILEKQYSNELIFQKQLLRTKHNELIKPENFNKKKIQESCQQFYFITYEQELMNARERNLIFKTNEDGASRKNRRINTFLTSKKVKDTIMNNTNRNSKLDSPNKNNKEYIDKLFNDIVYLNEKEKILEKKYRK